MAKSPTSIDIHVGSRIRLRRVMLGLSQEKLSDGLGITFQQVQKYEKGTNRVGASRLQRLSENTLRKTRLCSAKPLLQATNMEDDLSIGRH